MLNIFCELGSQVQSFLHLWIALLLGKLGNNANLHFNHLTYYYYLVKIHLYEPTSHVIYTYYSTDMKNIITKSERECACN